MIADTLNGHVDRSVDLKKQQNSESENPRWLLKFRLWFYGVCTAHFVFLAFALLTIDYESYGDERIVQYKNLRFKLLTVWANLMHLAYFPLCWFLTWWEYRGKSTSATLDRIQQFRNIWFTAILFPTTAYVCSFFWRVWLMERELLVPSYCDRFLPLWAQHGLHTDTVLFCTVELVAGGWRRGGTALRMRITDIFVVVYLAYGLFARYTDGIWMYPFLDQLPTWKILVFGFSVWLEHRFFFHLQWFVVDLVRRLGRPRDNVKLKGC